MKISEFTYIVEEGRRLDKDMQRYPLRNVESYTPLNNQ